MPAADTVFDERPLVSPANRQYRVIRTTEADAYELAKAKPPMAVPFGVKPKKAPGDTFAGTARKAAKLSIPNAKVQTYKDLKNLLKSLPDDAVMAARKPKIKTGATSNRVSQEKRNVRVRAFLYAASREADNDFHLILGRDPKKTPEMYMTMELSGLPPKSKPSFAALESARNAYKAFFTGNLPGGTYDFYDPPIPVAVRGALFFDMSHAKGQRPGPQSLKSRMPTIWEVHPITRIEFEP
jgi:hypothetical protein